MCTCLLFSLVLSCSFLFFLSPFLLLSSSFFFFVLPLLLSLPFPSLSQHLASLVSVAIHRVYQAWALGGGQETRERQEQVEEELRRKLVDLLQKKYAKIEQATQHVKPLVDKYFKQQEKEDVYYHSGKEQLHFWHTLDNEQKQATFKLKSLAHVSGGLLFDVGVIKSKVAELSPGFQIHGPDRYISKANAEELIPT
jgi:hypothetical protein